MMKEHYAVEVHSNGPKRCWWRIRRRGNNKIVLTSEVYSSLTKARDAAFQFAKLSGCGEVVERVKR